MPTPSDLRLFATAPRGIEALLAAELASVGAAGAAERAGGVQFSGDLAVAYRACLESRLANRILLPLAEFPIAGPDDLYAAAKAIGWTETFAPERTFAVDVAGHSPAATHTRFAALRVKDAIADAFRERAGRRPDVDTEQPDVQVNLHLHATRATVSLDLSGDSLHRRGYRQAGAGAPLKENLAAAILVRAGWPELAARGAPLLDPMCGSGTFLVEAALMAADVAPGLARRRFGFEGWRGHDAALWKEIRSLAEDRAAAGRARPLPPLSGSDLDAGALRAARDNARRAGFADRIAFTQADVSEARPDGEAPGLVVTNPPYGERLGAEAEVIKLHSLLGATLKAHFPGWRAAVFTGRPDLGPRIGLRAESMYSLYNGPLPCKLLVFEVPSAATEPGGSDFANRLRRNLRHLSKWARRTGVTCYRLYDADLPDYAVAVDLYQGAERHAHVQEYAAPDTVDPVKAEKRLREALAHIQEILELPAARIHYKLRRRQKRDAQYQRQAQTGNFLEVEEHGCRLLVNLDDYLDSGLFLDHRPLRHRLRQEARGQRFLNLFSYTGSATAHAAAGGAALTVSVDLSNTYLEWAERNLRANGFPARTFEHPPERLPDSGHVLLRADCRAWLASQAALERPPAFDRILLDPPTFSTSKRMEGTLDLQRDHVELVRSAARLLARDGVLYFSTNRRGFRLDAEALAGLAVEDITRATLDEDFRRPPPPHRCWKVRAPG